MASESQPSKTITATGSRRTRVAIQQASLASYRIPFFRNLASLPEMDITVLQGELPEIDNQTTNDFEVIETPIHRKSIFGFPVYFQRGQLRCADRSTYDVTVLVWNIQFAWILPTLVLARLRGVKTIVWGHGYSKRENSVRKRLRNLVFHLSDAAIVYDERTADTLKGQMPTRSGDVFVAANSICTESIQRARKQISLRPESLHEFAKTSGLTRAQTLLFVSRYDEANEVEKLVQAVAVLKEKHHLIRLVIIGKGSTTAPTLLNCIKELGVGENVIIQEAIYDEEQLSYWFESADLFCYPANMGLSVLHAFAYGLPVITHGRRELHGPESNYLRDGENGLLFKHGDTAHMIRCIDRVLSDNGLRARLSAEAARTSEMTTIHRMVDGFASAIRHVVNPASSSNSRHRVLKPAEVTNERVK